MADVKRSAITDVSPSCAACAFAEIVSVSSATAPRWPALVMKNRPWASFCGSTPVFEASASIAGANLSRIVAALIPTRPSIFAYSVCILPKERMKPAAAAVIAVPAIPIWIASRLRPWRIPSNARRVRFTDA